MSRSFQSSADSSVVYVHRCYVLCAAVVTLLPVLVRREWEAAGHSARPHPHKRSNNAARPHIQL